MEERIKAVEVPKVTTCNQGLRGCVTCAQKQPSYAANKKSTNSCQQQRGQQQRQRQPLRQPQRLTCPHGVIRYRDTEDGKFKTACQ